MRIGLIIASMLKFYQGGITYSDLNNMPYRQFLMYYDYMLHLQRWESEEGQKTNDMLHRTDNKMYNKK
jgi:hypothetical protein